jgi:hypothetical protein
MQHENGQENFSVEGMGGWVFIPPLQKLAVGARGARKLQANVRILRTLGFGHSGLREIYLTGNKYPETPGICPDTPDFVSGHSGPGVSGLTKDTLKTRWCKIDSQVFVWVLLSTSSKSKPADQSLS